MALIPVILVLCKITAGIFTDKTVAEAISDGECGKDTDATGAKNKNRAGYDTSDGEREKDKTKNGLSEKTASAGDTGKAERNRSWQRPEESAEKTGNKIPDWQSFCAELKKNNEWPPEDEEKAVKLFPDKKNEILLCKAEALFEKRDYGEFIKFTDKYKISYRKKKFISYIRVGRQYDAFDIWRKNYKSDKEISYRFALYAIRNRAYVCAVEILKNLVRTAPDYKNCGAALRKLQGIMEAVKSDTAVKKGEKEAGGNTGADKPGDKSVKL